MGKIHVLSENLANKIAAGEVIERPSSIVKELIENALDAGATSLEVEVNHGGRSLIRVADNGSGMTPEDAELAFKRHATSKIKTDRDLESILSFGFRGEALPSMAAVSRMNLVTRTQDASSGVSVTVEGGHFAGVRETPCSPGTSVEVRDLFFNTPARRKFLRTDATELGHIMDVVSHFALANPSLRMVFKSSGKTIYDLLPVPDARSRAEAVLGRETAKHLVAFEDEAPGIRVSGLAGKPFIAKANRTGQTFFINRRWIKSSGLAHALQAGYHGLLMHGQFPAAVVFIDVDPERVDVNVHPTKQEVRISNEGEIKSLLKRAVTQALQKAGDLTPSLRPFRSSEPAHPSAQPGPVSPVQENPYASFYDAPRSAHPSVPAESASLEPAAEASVQEPQAESLLPVLEEKPFGITKILGQIHHTFIVAETQEGLLLIDQHAAHERVMFEALLGNFRTGQPARQALLMDEILELHTRQVETLRTALPILTRIGFEIEEFGDKAFVLRAFPAVLGNENPAAFLKTFVEEREDEVLDTRLEQHEETIAALMACKRRSVKAHDPLTMVQMQALMERLARCENPFSCPHGRPAFFKKTFSELERQFKRK